MNEHQKNPVVTDAIQRFLNHFAHADLASLYHPGVELQVNVRPDGGELVEGRKGVYTNGIYNWFVFRIPKNARTSPEFSPWELPYPLAEHALAVGMTGWQFAKPDLTPDCRSLWVGFDFDAITGNSHLNSGISQEELDRVRDAACSIPWVEVRRSTGGGGLHLRVYLGDGIPTANHTEHAALGRAILGKMSAAVAFNFLEHVDTCGGNLWIWHRKMTAENRGLTLVTPRERRDLTEVPPNWRDHIDVVTRRRTRPQVAGIPANQSEDFERRATASKAVALDDQHTRLMDWLSENGWICVWDADRNMLRTHTAALAEAHEKLELRGMFCTLATGNDKSDYNCFCFPRPDGAWRVVRYGEGGCLEAPTWKQDGKTWTYCFLNQSPDLETAAAVCNGIEDQNGGFVFAKSADAVAAVKALGGELQLSDTLAKRAVKIKPHKDGCRLVAEIKSTDDDTDDDTRGYVVKSKTASKVIAAELPNASRPAYDDDESTRHLITPQNDDAGWAIRRDDGGWSIEPKSTAKQVLMADGMSGADADAAIGSISKRPYFLVNEPFQAEFLPGRRWNRDAARLRFAPTNDDREMDHPHFDKILDHCGAGLDDAVADDDWCKANGITRGRDYLLLWAARLIQKPTHPLPYLFFCSPENNAGKSAFHGMLGLLMTKGYECADTCLKENFNRQLAGAILCFVEETDLSQYEDAYSKVKLYTTGEWITIREMRTNGYSLRNTSHWIQTANKKEYCPIEPGDERIVAIQVLPIPIEQQDDWHEVMKPALEREAPDFLRTLLDTDVPPYRGRCGLPILTTDLKREMMGQPPAPKSDATPQLVETLDLFARCGWIIEATPSGVYDRIKYWRFPGLPANASQLGRVLNQTDWESRGLLYVADDANSRRVRTLATPLVLRQHQWAQEFVTSDAGSPPEA